MAFNIAILGTGSLGRCRVGRGPQLPRLIILSSISIIRIITIAVSQAGHARAQPPATSAADFPVAAARLHFA